jgi:hypothetical protein
MSSKSTGIKTTAVLFSALFQEDVMASAAHPLMWALGVKSAGD